VDGVLYNKDKTILVAYPAGKTGSSFTIPNGVTSIEQNAFAGCVGLTSITIPNSATSNGQIFSGCTSLTSITGPANFLYELAGSASLKTVNITGGSIDDFSMVGCAITNLTIDGVTSIGQWAFYACTNLTSVTIGNGVTSVGNSPFSNCNNITSLTISLSASGIYNIFNGNNMDTSLKTLVITGGSIGDYDFAEFTGLTSVTIGNGVTSIGEAAFAGCTGLTSVTIGNGVASIGDAPFNACDSLTAINVDATNSAYSSQDGVLYNKAKTVLIQYPGGKTGAFAIPNSVTGIRDYAFNSCPGLTSVTIPNNVASIGEWAFGGCASLAAINVDAANSAYSSVDGVLYNKANTMLIQYPGGKTGAFVIPNSVTSIEGWAFTNCAGLISVTIPSTVTSIGESAFNACASLTSVTFETGSNITNANFGSSAFPEGADGWGGNTLKNAYNTGKAGTYTRASGGSTWAKT